MPVSVMSMVSVASTSVLKVLVTTWPSMVPTERSVLMTFTAIFTGVRSLSASAAMAIRRWSKCLSSSWFWPVRLRSGASSSNSSPCRIGSRSSPSAFQWLIASRESSISAWPIASSMLRKPELGEDFADFLGEELEEVDHEFGLAVEPGPQLRVLRRDAHRAGVQVADAHHDAAGDHQRGGGETELLAAEQRGDDDVAAGLELAVHLHHHAVAQAVEHQGLLGLGEAELPRDTGVLERVQRRGAGTAVVPGNQHDVGLRLGDAGGHGADPDLGDELDVHPGRGVGALGVVDQLREVLDRVDVVVRGRGDESDAGRGVPRPGHPGVDLLRHQLAAFAGLGTLRHLDLDVVGVGQVQAGDAEAAGGDLLDRGTALGIQQPVHVLAAFTGVGLAAQPVHGDREGLVGFLGDGAVAHGAGGEPLDDAGDRLHFLQRHRRAEPALNFSSPRRVMRFSDWSSTPRV